MMFYYLKDSLNLSKITRSKEFIRYISLVIYCLSFPLLFIHLEAVQAQGINGEMTFEQTCLTDIDNPSSQNMAVDERNRIHLSRIDPGTRQLVYTQLNLGQEPIREVIADPLDLEANPVNDTDLIARHDQVYICAYRSTQMTRTLNVFIRDQEGAWREEIIEPNGEDGGECEITWMNDTLNVATERNGMVYWYQRGSDSWTHQAVSPEGESQGFDLRLTLTSTGEVLLTHRSFNYQELFLSQQIDSVWSTRSITSFDPYTFEAAGVRPQAIQWADGLIWIFHGSRNGNARLDFEADGYALVTEAPDPGENFTFKWSDYEGLGGINAAKILIGPNGEEEGYFLTRELIRNPVTGNRYGFRLHRFTRNFLLDEYYQLQQSMPGFPNFHLEPEIQADPAGLPILAHIDRAISETRSCIWRLADTDDDGLPDEGETRLGTDLNLADTDGDGRTDGLEIQEGTDPLVIDEANPLSWPPEVLPFDDDEMMAGADMAGSDMAGADMAGSDMAGADMAGADMAGADMAGADMAGADMAGADMAGADMAGADMAGADMAGADMAGADMAGADMAGADMAGADMAGADMAGADMAGADMAGADMAGLTWPALTWPG